MDKHPIPFKSFKDSCDYFSNHSDPKEGLNSEPEIEREDENYVLVNTIDEYLEEFKSQFKSESEYEKAKDALFNWFIAKKSYSGSPIFVKGRNKSKLAFVLGEIYRSEIDKPLSREFLQLIKSLFTTFSDEDLESKPINKTNLYKYLTTKTK